MLVYQDIFSGDELLSDSFTYTELEGGVLWEVEGKWVVQGSVDVNIGANPSAEGGEDDEGVDDSAIKVVDIIDTFRLQEQPSFEKKALLGNLKKYVKKLMDSIPEERKSDFKKNVEGAVKLIVGKSKDLQYFVGESMNDEGSMVFAFYKEGKTDPTFIYFADGLKEIKC